MGWDGTCWVFDGRGGVVGVMGADDAVRARVVTGDGDGADD